MRCRVRSCIRGSCQPRGDGGQIVLLVLAYALLAFVLATVVIGASAVHLERTRLLGLADGAALASAGALDRSRFYAPEGRSDAVVPLSNDTVAQAARDYLDIAPASARFVSLAVAQPTGSPDGATAEVTLVAVARLPLVTWALAPWRDGVPLQVTARARSQAVP